MNDSLSISNPHPRTDLLQKIGLLLAGVGVLTLLVAWAGVPLDNTIFSVVALGGIFIGTSLYGIRTYINLPKGIKNNGVYFDSPTEGRLGGSQELSLPDSTFVYTGSHNMSDWELTDRPILVWWRYLIH